MSEVYDRYVDTVGNYHYTDIETGHHVIPNMAVGSFKPPHLIKTNADRIRSMTDEELAHFLSIAGCPKGQTWSEGCAIPIDCEVCWSGWLKDEVKE